MSDRLPLNLTNVRVPHSWLDALAHEQSGHGRVKTYYKSLIYVDTEGTVRLRQPMESIPEAKEHERALRARHRQVMARRAGVYLVKG